MVFYIIFKKKEKKKCVIILNMNNIRVVKKEVGINSKMSKILN